MFLNTDAIKEALYNKSTEDIAQMIEEELERVAQEEAEKKAAAENEVSLLRDIAVEAVAEYFEALDVDVTDEDVEMINNTLKKYESLVPQLVKNTKILSNGRGWTSFFI